MTRMRSGLTGLLGGLVVTGVVLADHNDPTCPGDADRDGVVGMLDMVAVLVAWGECPDYPDPCDADLDGDGSVDVYDLMEVLANWMAVC